MKYNELGNTGIKVSEIGFGVLTLSKLQLNFENSKYKPILEHAITKRNINFFDTAEYYQAYDIIREAIKIKKDIVVCSKSYATNYLSAKKSLEKCLNEIGRDYVDIFLLHECETERSIHGSIDALKYYLEAKKTGKIMALGISTHAYRSASSIKLFSDLDIVMCIYNHKGIGILDGTIEEMNSTIEELYEFGKGILLIKILAGGHLLSEINRSFDFAKKCQYASSYILGMSSIEEIDYNCNYFENINNTIVPTLKNKKLHYMNWCTNCGKCIEACQQKALTKGKSHVIIDYNKCVNCGYCGGRCKFSALKIF